MDIVNEGIVGWAHELATGYARFKQRREEHVEPQDIEDSPLPDLDQLMDWGEETAEELRRIPLYRGMLLKQEQLETLTHLGIHWSRDFVTAKGFSHSGWSQYDTRFTKPEKGALNVIIAIAPIDPDQCDIVETLAVTIYGGENEVCMKQNQPVKIAMVYIAGVQQPDHPLIGQTRLT